MKQSFEVLNIKCEGCANRVKNALYKEFGEISVDLTKEPRVITLDIDNKNIPNLRKKIQKLGYPFVDEQLGTIKDLNLKAKSFVSCTIGKVDLKLNS